MNIIEEREDGWYILNPEKEWLGPYESKDVAWRHLTGCATLFLRKRKREREE